MIPNDSHAIYEYVFFEEEERGLRAHLDLKTLRIIRVYIQNASWIRRIRSYCPYI